MRKLLIRGLSVAVVTLLAFTIVADADAGHRHRRRRGGCCGGHSDYGYSQGYYAPGYATPGYSAPGYYGKGAYSSGGYGYGGYSGYAPAAGSYGGTTYAPAPTAGASQQPSVTGTANAELNSTDRSARANNDAGIRSSSDLDNTPPQGNVNAPATGSPNTNLPENSPVAP